jgi:phage terminase large subunit
MGIATLQKLDHMGYVNLYKQTKVANVSNDEGQRLGFRTTSATKPAIIGNLKHLIENDNILIPSPQIIQELKDYISTETGKTEAASGCYDDTVIALAICSEVLRTHWNRLSTKNVSWKEKLSDWTPDETNWL